jgi:hypothetical protein
VSVLSPSLLVLRIGYFNLALAVAAFGGLAVAGVVAAVTTGPVFGPVVALCWTSGVAATSMLAFPRVAGEWLALRG